MGQSTSAVLIKISGCVSYDISALSLFQDVFGASEVMKSNDWKPDDVCIEDCKVCQFRESV